MIFCCSLLNYIYHLICHTYSTNYPYGCMLAKTSSIIAAQCGNLSIAYFNIFSSSIINLRTANPQCYLIIVILHATQAT